VNPAAGTVLHGRYTLTERIAAGGMAEVWAATDTVLGRTVAVKLLSPALSEQSGFLERFRAEARYSAALDHPNITTVFDYGEDDGSAYLVMELVAGKPLSLVIAEGAPLSAHQTASILIQAANALEAAHRGGVVHRDVKPANILITPSGLAKLTDFGISRLANTASLTQAGQVLGTAQYLSPEQAMGQDATASSDVYALGVVGHEMLTGQRPFEGDTIVATALAHVNQPAPQLPDTVPVGIRTVISAALAKDPADRPATAATMALALGMPDVAFASVPGSGVAPLATNQAATTQAATTQMATNPAATNPAATDQAARTQVLGAVSPPMAQTQAMPAMAKPSPPQPPARPADRRPRRHPALLPAAIAAIVLAMLGLATVFALYGDIGRTGTKIPVVRVTAPQTTASTTGSTPAVTPPVATTPTATTPVTTAPVATAPAVTAPVPHQEHRGKGRNGDKKDGN
jgi:eukaryotic-like serine/threonine-protein kinase